MSTNNIEKLRWNLADLGQSLQAAGRFYYDCMNCIDEENRLNKYDFAQLLVKHNFIMSGNWSENIEQFRRFNSPNHPIRNYLIKRSITNL